MSSGQRLLVARRNVRNTFALEAPFEGKSRKTNCLAAWGTFCKRKSSQLTTDSHNPEKPPGGRFFWQAELAPNSRQAEPAPNPRIGCVQNTTSCLAGPSFYNIRAISATTQLLPPPQGDKVPQPSPWFLCNSTIIHSPKQNFLPKRFFCAILDKHLGADGCWCALWSSKPVIAVSSCIGGFNSHTFPPDKKGKGPQTKIVCGPFVVLPFSYRTIRWRHIPVRPQCGQVSLRRVRVW